MSPVWPVVVVVIVIAGSHPAVYKRAEVAWKGKVEGGDLCGVFSAP
jgi:hypothetical protein